MPGGLGKDLLDHEGVYIDERELDQVQGEHADFLVVRPIGGHLATLAEEDEVVGTVPVSMTFSPS